MTLLAATAVVETVYAEDSYCKSHPLQERGPAGEDIVKRRLQRVDVFIKKSLMSLSLLARDCMKRAYGKEGGNREILARTTRWEDTSQQGR